MPSASTWGVAGPTNPSRRVIIKRGEAPEVSMEKRTQDRVPKLRTPALGEAPPT